MPAEPSPASPGCTDAPDSNTSDSRTSDSSTSDSSTSDGSTSDSRTADSRTSGSSSTSESNTLFDSDVLPDLTDPAIWPRLFEGTLGERIGLEVLEASAERVVARIPVAGNTQPHGLLHGGASVALAESIGSMAAAIHNIESTGRHRVVGIDISASHHRGARSGWVTGVATPVHLGRTLATYDIVISDEQDRRICTCRLTCLLRD